MSAIPGLLMVDGWRDGAGTQEMLQPLSLESWAEIIAVGKVGEAVELGGRQVLPLELSDIIKGGEIARTLFPEDAAPWLGCLPPRTIPRPSERFPPGSVVLVYLDREPEGEMSILSLEAMEETRWQIERLRQYVDIEAPFRAADPDLRFLLPADRMLDEFTHWALFHNYPYGDSLRPALRGLVEHAKAAYDRGERIDTDHLANLMFHLRFGTALDGLEVGEAESWAALLTALRPHVSDERVVSGLFGTLARLPSATGLPTLLTECDTVDSPLSRHLFVALASWAAANRDDLENRARLRERVEVLRGDPSLENLQHSDVERRLEELWRAVCCDEPPRSQGGRP